MRPDDRNPDALRPVAIHHDYVGTADGSVLIEMGRTRVICTATIQAGVPRWLEGRDCGWVTAEYGMLPASGGSRIRRPGPGGVASRGVEIRRLIGRCLRATTNLAALGPNTVIVDCDVIEADGGTRTASITGGWVALARAVDAARTTGRLVGDEEVLGDPLTAVSVGVVDGEERLDMCYEEDSAAAVDMNVATVAGERLVEVQASGEEATFSQAELGRLVKLARKGCRTLAEKQRRARRARSKRR